MPREHRYSRSRSLDRRSKRTPSRDRSPKAKDSSHYKHRDSKRSHGSHKHESSHSHSHSHRSKRSRSSSYGRHTESGSIKTTKSSSVSKTDSDKNNESKVVERQTPSEPSVESGLKDDDKVPTGTDTTSTTSPTSDPSKSVDQNYWKDFPVPKFYKDLKKFYDPIPKPGDLPPSLYFPYDGPKVRRYKNYRTYKDPLSKYVDEEFYKKELRQLILDDLEYFKRKLDLVELNVEMASLGVPNI